MVRRATSRDKAVDSQRVADIASLTGKLREIISGLRTSQQRLLDLHDRLEEDFQSLANRSAQSLSEEVEKAVTASNTRWDEQKTKLDQLVEESSASLSELSDAMTQRISSAGKAIHDAEVKTANLMTELRQEWSREKVEQKQFREASDSRWEQEQSKTSALQTAVEDLQRSQDESAASQNELRSSLQQTAAASQALCSQLQERARQLEQRCEALERKMSFSRLCIVLLGILVAWIALA